jgi:hypothetical protein
MNASNSSIITASIHLWFVVMDIPWGIDKSSLRTVEICHILWRYEMHNLTPRHVIADILTSGHTLLVQEKAMSEAMEAGLPSLSSILSVVNKLIFI